MPKVKPYLLVAPKNWVKRYPLLARLSVIALLLVSPVYFPLYVLWENRQDLIAGYKDGLNAAFRPWRFR